MEKPKTPHEELCEAIATMMQTSQMTFDALKTLAQESPQKFFSIRWMIGTGKERMPHSIPVALRKMRRDIEFLTSLYERTYGGKM